MKETIPAYNCVFAQNYDSAFLFYPFTQPHGKSKAGLALFSKYPITGSLRRSFPISTSFTKFFDLDRCYSISRVPVDNGKELVIFELHMSAYGNSDAIREGQIPGIPQNLNPGPTHSHVQNSRSIFPSAWISCPKMKKTISGTVPATQIWNMYLARRIP